MLYFGMDIDEAVVANPTREFDAKMGDPDEFVDCSFRSMRTHLTPDA
jgi:hypothetical protein